LAARAKRERLESKFEGQLKAAGIQGYVRELRFHPLRKWRFDFAFPDGKLAVEIEGGKWIRGRHQRPGGFQSDSEKYNEAVRLGWRVLRFTGDDLGNRKAIDAVSEMLA
jgi:very-short-patch-repair endonuclease